MSHIINTNGQPVTAEENNQSNQRVALNGDKMNQIIGAYARLKQIGQAKILTPKDEAEKQGLVNFLTGAFFAHAEEFFGCWVTLQNEYTPLITGVTGLLHRALSRIDSINRQQQQSAAVQEVPDKPKVEVVTK